MIVRLREVTLQLHGSQSRHPLMNVNRGTRPAGIQPGTEINRGTQQWESTPAGVPAINLGFSASDTPGSTTGSSSSTPAGVAANDDRI